MNERRIDILDGKLSIPNYEGFLAKMGRPNADLANKMFKALWYAYLKNKGSINGVYWSQQFSNAKAFNQVLISLSQGGWINSHSIPARNWSEIELSELKLLEYVTSGELEQVRAHNKFRKYVLEDDESKLTSATRINGKVKNTGLVRTGFMKAGNTRFRYNREYMEKYADTIQRNLTKSMDKIADIHPELRHDRASYDTISCDILEFHIECDMEFTRGDNYNDSRGRAISSALGKVANPISFKDFRALLVIPD